MTGAYWTFQISHGADGPEEAAEYADEQTARVALDPGMWHIQTDDIDGDRIACSLLLDLWDVDIDERRAFAELHDGIARDIIQMMDGERIRGPRFDD